MKMGCKYVNKMRNTRGSIGDSNEPLGHLASAYGSVHLAWGLAAPYVSTALHPQMASMSYIVRPRILKLVFAVLVMKVLRRSRARSQDSA